MRFDHARHSEAAGTECSDCHVEPGSGGGVMKVAVVELCQDCHEQADVAMSASPWHGAGWVNSHASDAAASPQACASCHIRQDCLDCHLSGAASGSPGYHRADFLAGHATAAYSRETSCNDCHNAGAFCASCHQQAGLVTGGGSGSEFHNAGSSFATGHGQAARQSLESCVACHAETDCVRCHATTTGRISPHGPDWEGSDLQEKNPRMCTLCHVGIIPEGG
ncbi:cytochrome c3 family protein [Gemmatimonadota bacterium]